LQVAAGGRLVGELQDLAQQRARHGIGLEGAHGDAGPDGFTDVHRLLRRHGATVSLASGRCVKARGVGLARRKGERGGLARRLLAWVLVATVAFPVTLTAVYRFAPPPITILMVQRLS